MDIARAGVESDVGPEQVGAHVGTAVEGDRVVTHLFECLSPGYVGWRWAVTVNRAARSKVVTVSESVLLPGPDSLLAPDWVPWTDRVRPGDLKAGDLMPAPSDDERLVPYVAIAGEAGLLDWDDPDAWSLGAAQPGRDRSEPEVAPPDGGQTAPRPGTASGRSRRSTRSRTRPLPAIRPARALSAVGRDEAALRWYTGEAGPTSPLALAAPAQCQTCGFMIRLNSPLGRLFGVCANEFAPDDGKVVSADHGCGAHSDGELTADDGSGTEPTVDELGYDMLSPGATMPESVLETLDHELG